MKKIMQFSLIALSLFLVSQGASAINLGKIKLPGGSSSSSSTGGSSSVPGIKDNDPANVKLEKQIQAYVGKQFPMKKAMYGYDIKADSLQQFIGFLEAKYGKATMVEGVHAWVLLADKAEDTCIYIEAGQKSSKDYETGRQDYYIQTGGALCSSSRFADHGVPVRSVKH